MADRHSPTPTVIVTGAAGFAGGHLIDRLPGDWRVIGWYRPGGTQPDAGNGRVKWQAVDVTDRAAVAKAVGSSRANRIFHLAGAPSVATSWTNAVPHLRINVTGTEAVLDAVRVAKRPCRVLVVTSAQVYAPDDGPLAEDARLLPQSPYGFTKLAQDRLALAAAADGLDVVVARPFNHIGPRQAEGFAIASFARQIARIEVGLAPPVLAVGNLDTRRDITDVRDVVDAYVRVMDGGRPGRAYNVCSGHAWRIRDLLDMMLELATVTVEVTTDPARFRPVDVPIVQGDPTRLQTELGWTTRIGMEQTLRDTIEGWRDEVRDQLRS